MTAPAALNSEAARNALRQVKDPELDMNIVDLGLVYDVEIADGEVRVKMTLTSPGCPAGPMITNDAYRVLRGLEGVKDVDIEIVWEPYWTPERMDPKVRALWGSRRAPPAARRRTLRFASAGALRYGRARRDRLRAAERGPRLPGSSVRTARRDRAPAPRRLDCEPP